MHLPEHFNISIVGHLSINSIRNILKMIAKNIETIAKTITNFDIFLISESKRDFIYSSKEMDTTV